MERSGIGEGAGAQASAPGPARVQLSRARGWRMPPGTVKVDRSTKWGNPFKPGAPIAFLPGRKVADGRHAASLYAGHAPQNERLIEAAQAELAGLNLGCWCALCDLHRQGKPFAERCPYCEPCHADTLGQLANAVRMPSGEDA